jgi:hypothetical protein
MADVDGALIFDILKSIQRDLGDIKVQQGEIKSELAAVRGHLISLHQDVHNIYGVLGRHELQLERIENRLEIHEAPALT